MASNNSNLSGDEVPVDRINYRLLKPLKCKKVAIFNHRHRMQIIPITLLMIFVNTLSSAQVTASSPQSPVEFKNHRLSDDSRPQVTTPASLSSIVDSSNDFRTRSGDMRLDSLMLSHNEPHLDSKSSSNATTTTTASQSSSMFSDFPTTTGSTVTTTPANILPPTSTIYPTITTSGSIDEDDSMNRLFFQNSFTYNSLEESQTTMPSIEKATLDSITTSPLTPMTSTVSLSTEVIHTSESQTLTSIPNSRDILDEPSSNHVRRSSQIDHQQTSTNPIVEESTTATSVEPLITHPSLADLLYIIRHLNLSEGGEFNTRQKLYQTKQSIVEPMPSLEWFDRRFEDFVAPLAASTGESLSAAESVSPILKIDQQQKPSKRPEIDINQAPIGKLDLQHLTTKQPTTLLKPLGEKKSSINRNSVPLVSPYIANFDLSKNIALDKISRLNSLANTRKLLEKLKQLHQNKIASLNMDNENRRGSSMNDEKRYFSSDDGKTTSQISSPSPPIPNLSNKSNVNPISKHPLQQDIKLSKQKTQIVKNPELKGSIQLDSSKRGEREVNDGKNLKGASLNGVRTATNSNNHPKRQELENGDDIINKGKRNPTNGNGGESYDGGNRDNYSDQVRYTMANQFDKLDDFNVNGYGNKISSLSNSEQSLMKHHHNQLVPNALPVSDQTFPTFLADNTGVLENLNPNKLNHLSPLSGLDGKRPSLNFNQFQSQNDDLNFDDYPGPLTIGELAGHHGVPFRLRIPDETSYKLPTNSRSRIPMESNQYEDYVYTALGGTGANNLASESVNSNNIGTAHIDEEIKKKLALKTIEAITQYPELSKTLFNNLYNSLDVASYSAPEQPVIRAPQQMLKPVPNWSKIYASLLNNNNVNLPMEATSSQGSLPVILPPSNNQFLGLESNLLNLAHNHHHYSNDHILTATTNRINSTTPTLLAPMNHQQAPHQNKWALTRMPDLIPIPLAATVPGYLIRLPNGQILAAALTNSFSIQGIQKGPLSHGYKKFLNQRFKNFIKPSNHKPSMSGGYMTADSGMNPVILPAPSKLITTTVKNSPSSSSSSTSNADKVLSSSGSGGLFSRGVLSQLGFSRSNQRPISSASGKSKATNFQSDNKVTTAHKLVKLTGSDALQTTPISDQELASLPMADFNEPVFSFADESQIIDSSPEYTPVAAASTNNLVQSQLAPTNGLLADPTDMFQNENALALRAKLNQLLSIKSFFNEDIFQGSTTASKRSQRQPPQLAASNFLLPQTSIKCRNQKGSRSQTDGGNRLSYLIQKVLSKLSLN